MKDFLNKYHVRWIIEEGDPHAQSIQTIQAVYIGAYMGR
jgi:hypothetical protein